MNFASEGSEMPLQPKNKNAALLPKPAMSAFERVAHLHTKLLTVGGVLKYGLFTTLVQVGYVIWAFWGNSEEISIESFRDACIHPNQQQPFYLMVSSAFVSSLILQVVAPPKTSQDLPSQPAKTQLALSMILFSVFLLNMMSLVAKAVQVAVKFHSPVCVLAVVFTSSLPMKIAEVFALFIFLNRTRALWKALHKHSDSPIVRDNSSDSFALWNMFEDQALAQVGEEDPGILASVDSSVVFYRDLVVIFGSHAFNWGYPVLILFLLLYIPFTFLIIVCLKVLAYIVGSVAVWSLRKRSVTQDHEEEGLVRENMEPIDDTVLRSIVMRKANGGAFPHLSICFKGVDRSYHENFEAFQSTGSTLNDWRHAFFVILGFSFAAALGVNTILRLYLYLKLGYNFKDAYWQAFLDTIGERHIYNYLQHIIDSMKTAASSSKHCLLAVVLFFVTINAWI